MELTIDEMKENMIRWAMEYVGRPEYIGWCLDFVEDGKVIHAWNRVRIDGYLAIEELSSAGEHSRYLGWVPLQRVLQQKA